MALKIRLRQQGRRNRIVYRLVLSDSRSPRDGKYIEVLGWYNPHESEPEKCLNICGERVQHWLNQGAILTEKAETLVKKGAPAVIDELRKRRTAAKTKACQKRKSSRKNKELATA